jgi:hypothetical protein
MIFYSTMEQMVQKTDSYEMALECYHTLCLEVKGLLMKSLPRLAIF